MAGFQINYPVKGQIVSKKGFTVSGTAPGGIVDIITYVLEPKHAQKGVIQTVVMVKTPTEIPPTITVSVAGGAPQPAVFTTQNTDPGNYYGSFEYYVVPEQFGSLDIEVISTIGDKSESLDVNVTVFDPASLLPP